MSLYKDASLAMIPSAYKDGKLYSIRPTDGSGDFTFSRGSNLAATRVDVNGLIEKGRENLLTYSNSFNNWNKSLCNVTSSQSGYDGTNDAWLLTATGSGNSCRRDVTYSGVNSFSVYAKAGTADGIRLRFDAATDRNLMVDLTDGSVISAVTTAFAYSVEAVGGGWYRITATADLTSGINVRLIVTDDTGTQSTGSVYIQDAQLEQGLVATDYIETGATTAQAGILEDMPRLDYSGGASCPSLLLEPQRTNLFDSSEYTNTAYWQEELGITQEQNTTEVTSPEGVYNAVRLISANATSPQSIINVSPSITTGNDYSVSLFVKKRDYDYFQIRFTGIGSAFTAASVWFNIDEGSVGTTDSGIVADIEDYSNGWYRIIATKASSATGTGGIRFNLASSDGVQNVVGDGSKGTYVYGFQIEQGSYPTSYIPTYGSSVTRSLDSAVTPNLTADGVATNPNAWTFVVKGDWTGNGAPANNHTFSRQEGGFMYRYGGSMGFSGATKTYWTEYNPTAATAYIWDGTQLRIRREGSDIRTISAAAIGWNSGGISNWSLTFVNIRNIQYEVDQVLLFNSVLTDSEIDQLTA